MAAGDVSIRAMEVPSASDKFATFGEGGAEDGGAAVAVTLGSDGEVAARSSSSAVTETLVGNSSSLSPPPPPDDAENHIQEPILLEPLSPRRSFDLRRRLSFQSQQGSPPTLFVL